MFEKIYLIGSNNKQLVPGVPLWLDKRKTILWRVTSQRKRLYQKDCMMRLRKEKHGGKGRGECLIVGRVQG
jgi:hypothetical protein